MCLQSVCVCVCIFTSVCFCWTTEWYFFSFVKCDVSMHLLFLKGRCVVLRQHWFTMELILILLICLKLPWLDDEGPCVCVCMIKSGGIGGLCYFKLCVWTVQYYICFVWFFLASPSTALNGLCIQDVLFSCCSRKNIFFKTIVWT